MYCGLLHDQVHKVLSFIFISYVWFFTLFPRKSKPIENQEYFEYFKISTESKRTKWISKLWETLVVNVQIIHSVVYQTYRAENKFKAFNMENFLFRFFFSRNVLLLLHANNLVKCFVRVHSASIIRVKL